jgi:hypothetical protein
MAVEAEPAHLVPATEGVLADSDAWGFLRRIGSSKVHLEASDAKVAGEILDLLSN